jgi:hypothetical protein
MNHLEQLVSEWLQYRGYFVKVSVLVGRRPRGGSEGELDVVGLNPARKHLIHVECSLDANKWEKRHASFAKKFACGRKYIKLIFEGLTLPDGDPDQVALLQFAAPGVTNVGGARLVTGKQFIREVFDGLRGTSPSSGAVPSTLPLLRTLQLATTADKTPSSAEQRLIRF